jgi:hypothetical protein
MAWRGDFFSFHDMHSMFMMLTTLPKEKVDTSPARHSPDVRSSLGVMFLLDITVIDWDYVHTS